MKKYLLTVSEPWDFKSSRGTNVLSGEIVREIDHENLIFESEEEIEIQNTRSRLLVLSTRYQGDKIKEGDRYQGTVNVGILLTEDYKSKNLDVLKNDAKFVIIGSLSQ